MKNTRWILLLFLVFACGESGNPQKDTGGNRQSVGLVAIPVIQPEGMTLCERFMPPAGFSRVGEDPGSFGAYLRGLPLKPHGEKVRYYHGGLKNSTSVYAAVVDLPIGNRDLHQCADAVMRLRAEYLYMVQDYDAIHFNFTNGFRVDYSEWIKGNRIVVRGNNVSWVHSARPSIEYPEFWKYMEVIFTYAGTLSLSKEMTRVPAQEMQIGDVFIQGGSPGHAIIVVDMAENPDTGERLFMLAQSYMPAQEIQVLENPVDAAISPWYPLDFGEVLYTPEWTFRRDDLKRFAR